MAEHPSVSELVVRWQVGQQRGEEVSAEKLCANCPELLSEVRRRIEALPGVTAPGPAPSAGTETLNSDPGIPAGPNLFPWLAPSADATNLDVTRETLTPPDAVGPVSQPDWPDVPGYQILGELGRGGMGVVYKARQVKLNRLVALKMVQAGTRAGGAERTRFRIEAEAVARLQHPNIVQIHEVGEAEGRPFFSLEYVEGGSLDRKSRGSPFAPRPAAELVASLARAMHYAHQQGIIHRDLKPANVLLASGGREPPGAAPPPGGSRPPLADCIPKITDFGLAKQLDSDSGQTQSGAILGTPSYMAPEQAGGRIKEIGPAADVYALGAILYELLTGRPPFRGQSHIDTLKLVCSQEPTAPSRLQKVPRDLETICLKCLEKDPKRRYASAAELAEDLGCFLNHEPIRARPAGLVERGVKWVRRRPAATLAGLVVLLLLGGGAGGYWLWLRLEAHRRQSEEREEAAAAARRVNVEYYNKFVRRRGLPEGIGPVTAEEARHLHFVCKLYRRGGRAYRVDLVNGLGRLTGVPPPFSDYYLDQQDSTPDRKRACSFHFRRDAQGGVTEERAYDQAGRLVWRLHYTSPTTAQYQDADGVPHARTSSGAAYVRFVWSREGFARQIWYLDREGRRKPNKNGIYGQQREVSEHGLIRRITNVNDRGRPMLARNRAAGYAMRHNARGRILELEYFGLHGQPVLCKYGYHRVKRSYDAQGNRIASGYFGSDGKPVRCSAGYHGLVKRFDTHGNEIEAAFFDTNDRPLLLNRSGYHRRTARHDRAGREIEQAFFGVDGQPVLHADGYHRWTARYDGQGNEIERAFFGLSGRRVLLKSGYHRWAARYDDRGNQTEAAYFGTGGQPVRIPPGHHKWTGRYDERGNQVEGACFGNDGKPAVWANGHHRWTALYDERGNEVEFVRFGLDGRPVLHRDGYARIRRSYDDRGNQVETAYLGAAGEPVLHREGYHKRVWAYDERGNETASAFFGRDGKPVLLPNGHHRWARRYDGQDRESELAYLDTDGQPVVTRAGHARVTWTYNERGRLTEKVFWILDPHGAYVRSRAKVNAQGKVSERAYFTGDDKPALHPDGYHRWTARYDGRGRQTDLAYFGTDGRPILGPSGYHRRTNAYDERGRQVQGDYFGVDGRPVLLGNGSHRWRARYDGRSKQIEMTFFGVDGKPVLTTSGCHRWTARYDGRGHKIEAACFGTDDRPAVWTNGHHRWTAKYDERGNQTEEAYYGLDGKPTRLKNGYARLTWKYNDQKQQIDKAAFDADGQPVPLEVYLREVSPGGRAERLGLRVGDVLVSSAGRPVQNSARFAHGRRTEQPDDAPRTLEVLRQGQQLAFAISPGLLGIRLGDRARPR
jgi:YD repeat-containing protein